MNNDTKNIDEIVARNHLHALALAQVKPKTKLNERIKIIILSSLRIILIITIIFGVPFILALPAIIFSIHEEYQVAVFILMYFLVFTFAGLYYEAREKIKELKKELYESHQSE